MHEATWFVPPLMDGSEPHHQTFSLYNMEADPGEAGVLQAGCDLGGVEHLAQSHTHLAVVSGLKSETHLLSPNTRPFKTQINTSCARTPMYEVLKKPVLKYVYHLA